MRLLLRTPLNAQTGYGTDGISLAHTLAKLGVDVYLDPAHVQAPLPAGVANLLTKRLEPPFDVLLHHTDPGQLGISPEARGAATVTVAHTMWEYSTVGNMHGRSTLRRRLRDYDLVVGYDRVSTEALAPHVTGRTATVQGGYRPELWPYQRRDWTGERFSYCMVGALHLRKAPFIAIEAFKELKDDKPEFAPAELHLKTVSPGLSKRMQEWAPGLFIHYEMWPESTLRQFYTTQHVLLAPSRGEGKNLPALEFMSTGGTVIATNWGGHEQWMNSEYAYPLDYTLAPVSPATPDCRNARADKEHLKALMWQTFTNRAETKRKGDTAARIIPAMCGWEPVIDRLFTKIADQVPGHGSRLLQDLRSTAEHARQAVKVTPDGF